MSDAGQPMPPPGGAPAGPQPQGQVNPQEIMGMVQKGLVQLVQTIAQATGAPPPLILKAIEAAMAQVGGGGQPPQTGMRPTQ